VLEIAGRDVRRADAVGLQAVFETDRSYFETIEAAPLRPDEAVHALVERPAIVPLERKYVWIIDGVAVLDVIEGYPDATTWYLGLIFLAPAARGAGLGTELIEALCAHVLKCGGTALRLAVMLVNPDARRLYDRLGFQYVDRRVRTSWNGAISECDVLERVLA
jgi:GNAT superfamily N-acetyltransferase